MECFEKIAQEFVPTLSKQNLRKMYKSIRSVIKQTLEINQIEKETINKSIKTNILFLLQKQSVESGNKICISTYYPINDEIDCLSILNQLHVELKEKNINIQICLPKMGEGRILKFYEYLGEDSLIIFNKFGIKEPNDEICKELIPNFIITPLLAFDRHKHRLGYGKGYYDNTFNHLKNKFHNFISVGIAYDQQFHEYDLPSESHDYKLDYVITQSKLL